jgi:hypothetical protein
MSGFLFHTGASAICPHGGQVSTIPSSTRVLLGGQPAATMGDQYLVAGCVFTVPTGKPQPCVEVKWLVPALRVRMGGEFAILQTSTGLCQSAEQIPQGPPSVLVTQIRVRGS